jgi:hypothetical protein
MNDKMTQNENFFLDLQQYGGSLFIEDVIIYYDKPLLFTCVNALKSRFLVNCIDESDTDIEWLIAKISNKRLGNAYKRKISLYEVFKNTENQRVLLVKQLQSVCKDSIVDMHELPCSSLTIDQLPTPDSYIESENDSKYIELLDCDEENPSLIFSLSGKPVKELHTIDAEFAGAILNNFVKLVKIAVKHLQTFTSVLKDGISQDSFLSKYDLLLSGTEPGSFNFKIFTQAKEVYLFENDSILPAVDSIIGLLDSSLKLNDDNFKEYIKKHHTAEVFKLKELLSLSLNAEAYFTITHNSNHFQFRNTEEVRLSLSKFDLSPVQEYEEEVKGAFLGVLPKSKSFEFKDTLEEKKRVITGKFDKSIEQSQLEDFNQTKLLKECVATFKVYPEKKTNKFSVKTMDDIVFY